MKAIFNSAGVWNNGIVLVRVLTGWLIMRHSFELFEIDGLLDFLKDVKFPFPVFSGYAAKIIELVGGLCLILGLFTRWVTPLLMVTMAGVIFTMHKGNFYEGEHPLLFMLIFAGFFFCGPGKWSLDYWLEHRKFSV